MAENKKPGEEEVAQMVTKAGYVKAQANYEGNEHSDLVKITIIKDGNHYKKGDTDIVHPSLAELLKAKGLIADLGKKHERPKFDQKDTTIDA